MNVLRMSREELKKRLDRGESLTILDVRNPTAWSGSGVKLPGAVRIPVGELEERAGELDPSREVVAYCT